MTNNLTVPYRGKVLEHDLYCMIAGINMPKKEPMTQEAAERIANTSKDTKFIERAREAAKKHQ